jgi:hypothetical protein
MWGSALQKGDATSPTLGDSATRKLLGPRCGEGPESRKVRGPDAAGATHSEWGRELRNLLRKERGPMGRGPLLHWAQDFPCRSRSLGWLLCSWGLTATGPLYESGGSTGRPFLVRVDDAALHAARDRYDLTGHVAGDLVRGERDDLAGHVLRLRDLPQRHRA